MTLEKIVLLRSSFLPLNYNHFPIFILNGPKVHVDLVVFVEIWIAYENCKLYIQIDLGHCISDLIPAQLLWARFFITLFLLFI